MARPNDFSILTEEEVAMGFTENGLWTYDSKGLVWRLQMNRRVTDEEYDRYSEIVNGDRDVYWDKELDEFSLPACLGAVKEAAPGTTAKLWWHRPILVLVHPLSLPKKVYEMINVMSGDEAKQEAKKAFHEQFGHTRADAILKATIATEKDLRKFVEAR